MRIALALMTLCALAAADSARAEYTRSSAEVARFKRAYPCPTVLPIAQCRTARVDHRQPLCSGGADSWRTNMQWQPYADSRAKDREEIGLCAAIRAGRLAKPRSTAELCRALVPADRWPWMRRANCASAPRPA